MPDSELDYSADRMLQALATGPDAQKIVDGGAYTFQLISTDDRRYLVVDWFPERADGTYEPRPTYSETFRAFAVGTVLTADPMGHPGEPAPGWAFRPEPPIRTAEIFSREEFYHPKGICRHRENGKPCGWTYVPTNEELTGAATTVRAIAHSEATQHVAATGHVVDVLTITQARLAPPERAWVEEAPRTEES